MLIQMDNLINVIISELRQMDLVKLEQNEILKYSNYLNYPKNHIIRINDNNIETFITSFGIRPSHYDYYKLPPNFNIFNFVSIVLGIFRNHWMNQPRTWTNEQFSQEIISFTLYYTDKYHFDIIKYKCKYLINFNNLILENYENGCYEYSPEIDIEMLNRRISNNEFFRIYYCI